MNVEFERIGQPFAGRFNGICAVDSEHRTRRGDMVSRVQRADNPMLPVTGVACKSCTKELPKAHR